MGCTPDSSSRTLRFGSPLISILVHVTSAISNNIIYTVQERWAGFAQHAQQRNKLPADVQSLMSSVATALGVKRPLPPVTVGIDVEIVVPEMSNTNVMVAGAFPAPSHLPYVTTAVPARKPRHSSMIARSRKKRRSSTTTATETAVVTEKGRVDVTDVAKSSHLSPEMVSAQGALLQAMRTVCCVYNRNFKVSTRRTGSTAMAC